MSKGSRPAAPAPTPGPAAPAAAGVVQPETDIAGPILNPVSKKPGASDPPPSDLDEYTEKLRPFLDRYGRLIALVAVAAVLALLSWAVWRNYARSGREAGWGELFAATDTAGFEAVAEVEADTDAAVWAHLAAAHGHYDSGMNSAFRDRAAADDSFTKAREQFDAVLGDTTAPDEARVRALYGLAAVEEVTGGGDLSKARDLYGQVADDYPDSPLAPAAELRIERLASGGAEAFYAWFASQNPAPRDLDRPLDQPAGGDAGDDLLPTVDDADADSEAAAPEAAAPEAAGAAAAGAAASSADDPPADDPPATDDPSATDTPPAAGE